MNQQLIEFYNAVMEDLVEREFMFTNKAGKPLKHDAQLTEKLIQAQNIRLLITRRARLFGLPIETTPDEETLKRIVTEKIDRQDFSRETLDNSPTQVFLNIRTMHNTLLRLMTAIRDAPENTLMYRGKCIKKSNLWQIVLAVDIAARLHQNHERYSSASSTSIVEISPSVRDVRSSSDGIRN